MAYAILHIPPAHIINKYHIGERFCNLAIGDGDVNCFHITDSYALATDCLNYYRNKWPEESYELLTIEYN